MTTATIHEWYRFLDAHSDDEAVCELRRLSTRLHDVLVELDLNSRPLGYCPDPDVDQALRVSRSTLGEAIEFLEQTAGRFRAGERHQTV